MSGDLDLPARPFSKEAQTARASRRYHRTVASPKRWQAIIAAKMGPCRCCSAPAPNELHHLIPRSQGGSDTESCLVPLCRDCHLLVESRDPGAGMKLALSLSDDEYAFMVEHGGEGVLERRLGVVYSR